MSIRSQMTRQFASDFDSILDSGLSAVQAYSNSQYNKLTTQVKNDYNAFIDELAYSNDFENYESMVEQFWANEDAKIKDGGYGGIATTRYMENDRQNYYEQMRTSANSMMIDGSWRGTKVNYELAVRNIISDDVNYPTYDSKMAAIQKEFDSDGLKDFPIKLGSVTQPDEWKDTVKAASLQQAFNERNVYAYADRYFQEGMTIDEILSEMKGSSGISNWSETDEDTARTYIQKSLTAIGTQRQTVAVNAQSEIVSLFTTKYMKGEDYTAQDIINEATARGAFREDGTVDRFWAAFLSPYIEYQVAQDKIDEAEAKTQETLDKLGLKTGEDALGVLGDVANGSFEFKFTPSAQTPKVSTNVPIPEKTADGDTRTVSASGSSRPVISAKGQKGTGLNVSESVVIQPEGEVVVDGEDTGAKAFESNTGDVWVYSSKEVPGLDQYQYAGPAPSDLPRNYVFDETTIEDATRETPSSEKGYLYRVSSAEDRPVIDKDYVPAEGEGGHLSDEMRQVIEDQKALQELTEGTEFAGVFNTEMGWSTSRLEGRQTYSVDGLPDIDSQYSNAVIALCQAWGVDYDPKSVETYYVAQIVQDLADSGAFSNPNKAMAVQTLAVKRLDPGTTPEEYNSYLMQYKNTGILTDKEIDEYGLSKHAFESDVSDTAIKDKLNYAFEKAFSNLYSMSYSTTNYEKLNTKQKDDWFTMKDRLEQELKRAIQTNPIKAQTDPLSIVDDVVEKLTDKAFAEGMWKLYNKRQPNVIATDVKNHEGVTFSDIFTLFDFNPDNDYNIGFVSTRRVDETELGSEILQDWCANILNNNSKYNMWLNRDVVAWYNNAQTTTSSGFYTTPRQFRKQADEIAKNVFGAEDYDALSNEQKNSLMFSYTVARSQIELAKSTCNTFGYELDEVCGNIVVAPSGENRYGGGQAVVTKDGRVFMSGGDPDSSGHRWIIGSVNGHTLDNIMNGADVIAFEEISANGLKYFSDGGLQYTKDGLVLNRKNRQDKEFELTGLLSEVQPDRYNITTIGK